VELSQTRKRVRKSKMTKHDQALPSQLPLSDLSEEISANVEKTRKRKSVKTKAKPLPIDKVDVLSGMSTCDS